MQDPLRSHLAHQISLQVELCVIQFPRDLSDFLNMTSEVKQRENGFDLDSFKLAGKPGLSVEILPVPPPSLTTRVRIK